MRHAAVMGTSKVVATKPPNIGTVGLVDVSVVNVNAAGAPNSLIPEPCVEVRASLIPSHCTGAPNMIDD